MSDAGSLSSVSPILLLGGAGQLGLTLCQSLSMGGYLCQGELRLII